MESNVKKKASLSSGWKGNVRFQADTCNDSYTLSLRSSVCFIPSILDSIPTTCGWLTPWHFVSHPTLLALDSDSSVHTILSPPLPSQHILKTSLGFIFIQGSHSWGRKRRRGAEREGAKKLFEVSTDVLSLELSWALNSLPSQEWNILCLLFALPALTSSVNAHIEQRKMIFIVKVMGFRG